MVLLASRRFELHSDFLAAPHRERHVAAQRRSRRSRVAPHVRVDEVVSQIRGSSVQVGNITVPHLRGTTTRLRHEACPNTRDHTPSGRTHAWGDPMKPHTEPPVHNYRTRVVFAQVIDACQVSSSNRPLARDEINEFGETAPD